MLAEAAYDKNEKIVYRECEQVGNFLFVNYNKFKNRGCKHHICRSPIAQGCATKLVLEKSLDIKVDSSGTGSWHIGETPCASSIKICKSNGVDISMLRASQFNSKDRDSYDLIVALDDKNFKDLKALGAKNLVKLGDYGYNSQDVPDPYFFGTYEGFDKVFTMIESCVKNLFEKEFKQ